MNKHALFIYGDYRTFDWCHLWYANKIPENVDVYISTYTTSFEQKTGEIQWSEKEKTWSFIELSTPPTPPRRFPNSTQYSTAYITQGINNEIFEDVFGDNLKSVHISNRDFNEWIPPGRPADTTAFIVKHLQKIVEDIPIEKRKEYKNIYILRLDCIPVIEDEEVFTFDEKLFKKQFDLEEDTLYTQSEEDMEDWTFAQDLVFCGRADTIIRWIEYLNPEKHFIPHLHIANATGEMVKKGILKHKTFIDYSCRILRRSMVPFFSHYWNKGIYPLGVDESRNIFYKFQKIADNIQHRLYYT